MTLTGPPDPTENRSTTTMARRTAATARPRPPSPRSRRPPPPRTSSRPADLDALLEPPADDPVVEGAVPAAGALDAPEEPQLDPGPPVPAHVVSGEVGIDAAKQKPAERLLDEETLEPLDPDTLFSKVEGPGSTFICTRRIVQELNAGEGWSSTMRLVMPAGQVVSEDRAEQLLALVRAQADTE